MGPMRERLTLEAAAAELKSAIREAIDYSEALSDDSLRDMVEERIQSAAKELRWSSGERVWLMERVLASFRGLDVIEPLIADAAVTEIMVNGHEDIFYEKNGRMHRYPYSFESRERLEDLIQMIVSKVNRTLNEATPIVDARLPDGSRVHAVLPPISLKGPTLTIRKFPEKPLTMARLIELEALTGEAADFLRDAVRSKRNIFISGGTGSGKTTLLNVLAQSIPDDERVVTIEDSAELQLRTIPNLVSLETRTANTEGKGEISIRQLIRAALRMRPNRIVVGEVRGAEALDMLQAMNTGHEGSLSTGHSNSVRDMLSRLESMAVSGAELPLEVVRRQIASAIHLIVQVSRMPDYTRKITEILELRGFEEGRYRMATLFRRERGERGGELVRVDAMEEYR